MGVIRKKTATRVVGEGGTKYICDNCSADVTSTVRIRCAHLACHEYDLCVQCFGAGSISSASSTHSVTHPFRVIEQNSVPIYEETWGADEELLLLEGAEVYGLGSWVDIANHVGGYRLKEEVEQHYLECYLQPETFPLPKHARPDDTELLKKVPREEFQIAKKRRIEARKEEAKNAPPVTPKGKPTASVPSCHEVMGYMPGRLEFEHEHFNEAEEAVMAMNFDPGDGVNPITGEIDPETELKLTVMQIYNNRLDDRLDRKKIIFEHNLLEYKKHAALDKKRTKEERDMLHRAKPFARMMNRSDFENFNAGLISELNLRQAIAQIQEWRRNGIGDLRQGERYESDKLLRQQKQQPMGSLDRERFATQRSKALLAPEIPSGTAALIAPELSAKTLESLGDPASLTSHTNGVGSPAIKATNGTSTPISMKKKDVIANAQATLSVAPISGIIPLISLSSKPALSHKREDREHDIDIPWNDTHLLTDCEIDLCKVLRMQPKPYLVLKGAILAEALRGDGKLKKKQVRDLWKDGLEGGRGGRIWESYIQWGWIAKA